MENSASPSLSDTQTGRKLRQLQLLVGLLIASNIGMGAFSVYLLRVLDQHYTALIDRSIPVLAELRELLAQAVVSQRSTGPQLLTAPDGGRASLIKEARVAIERDRQMRRQLLDLPAVAEETEARTRLESAGEAHAALSNEILSMVAEGKVAEASALRDAALRKVFDDYQAAIGFFADLVKLHSMADSDNLTGKMENMSALALGVASWPVIVIVVIVGITVISVVVLMLLYRRPDED